MKLNKGLAASQQREASLVVDIPFFADRIAVSSWFKGNFTANSFFPSLIGPVLQCFPKPILGLRKISPETNSQTFKQKQKESVQNKIFETRKLTTAASVPRTLLESRLQTLNTLNTLLLWCHFEAKQISQRLRRSHFCLSIIHQVASLGYGNGLQTHNLAGHLWNS